ncbi:probable methyltransferase-like protein 15 [Protobothrops mucrosquamatus]|uniref:probable methyltransferase-like protein 15 n=1 Tax=Protobothrops mucrosquamatus TaxID=103944 RepID=UPI00077565EA|nr:probable methyltransferase-like protein 15 [Protobothrops mucrosquamatus]
MKKIDICTNLLLVFTPCPSSNFVSNMHWLPCLQKIYNQFTLHTFIPNCLGMSVKCIHASLVSTCEAETKSLRFSISENLQDEIHSEDSQQLHKSVMMEEVIEFLVPQKEQHILDMTFGAGGHTKAILQKAKDIKIYALDRDPTAYELAQQLCASYPQQIQPLLGTFSQAEALLTSSGVQPASLDGVLLDAGCSSLQLDTPERGFSLKKDGPLDMRMDGDRYPDTPTAADVVNALDQQALASILKTYGEEKHAKKIASTIVQARSIYPITRTRQLASIIADAFPETILYARKDKLSRPAHIATKTFQALRIFVNNELHELYEGLKAAEHFLKPGGRLVAITFHSLEDCIVKRFLHGIDISEKFNLSVRQKIRRATTDLLEEEDELLSENCSLKWKLIEKKVVTPQDTEIKNNPRGRSAKLRGAIRL